MRRTLLLLASCLICTSPLLAGGDGAAPQQKHQKPDAPVDKPNKADAPRQGKGTDPRDERPNTDDAERQFLAARQTTADKRKAIAEALSTAEKSYRNSNQYVSSIRARTKAQAQVDAACTAAREALKSSSTDYAKALADYQAAVVARNKATAEPTVTADQRMAAANEVMRTSGVVSRLESAALDADPKVIDARKRYQQAADAVRKLDQGLAESIRQDPTVAAARKDLEQSRAAEAEAEKEFTDTQAAAEEYDRKQQDERDAMRREEEQVREKDRNKDGHQNVRKPYKVPAPKKVAK